MLRVLDISPCTRRRVSTRRVNNGRVPRMSQANEYVLHLMCMWWSSFTRLIYHSLQDTGNQVPASQRRCKYVEHMTTHPHHALRNMRLTGPIVRASKAPGRRKVRLTLYVLPHSGPSGLDPKDHQSAHLIDHASQSQLPNPAGMCSSVVSNLLTAVPHRPRRT